MDNSILHLFARKKELREKIAIVSENYTALLD